MHPTAKAAEVFSRCHLTRFPINPLEIAREYHFNIMTYEMLCSISGWNIQLLYDISNDGFSFSQDHQFYIVYNPLISSKGRRRWTLLHETSHILLGHVEQGSPFQLEYWKKPYLEAEADALTRALIAPLPMMMLCRCQDAKDVQRIFGVSLQAAGNLYMEYRHMLDYKIAQVDQMMQYGDSLNPFLPFAMAQARAVCTREIRRRQSKKLSLDINMTDEEWRREL